jgi:hypothetical protein
VLTKTVPARRSPIRGPCGSPGTQGIQRHHLRLRAQRGAQPTTAAVTTAIRLWFRYRRNAAVPNHLQQRWIDRHVTITPDLRGHILITRYPEIITLSAMIRSPFWFAAVLRPYHPSRSNRRWIPASVPTNAALARHRCHARLRTYLARGAWAQSRRPLPGMRTHYAVNPGPKIELPPAVD